MNNLLHRTVFCLALVSVVACQILQLTPNGRLVFRSTNDHRGLVPSQVPLNDPVPRSHAMNFGVGNYHIIKSAPRVPHQAHLRRMVAHHPARAPRIILVPAPQTLVPVQEVPPRPQMYRLGPRPEMPQQRWVQLRPVQAPITVFNPPPLVDFQLAENPNEEIQESQLWLEPRPIEAPPEAAGTELNDFIDFKSEPKPAPAPPIMRLEDHHALRPKTDRTGRRFIDCFGLQYLIRNRKEAKVTRCCGTRAFKLSESECRDGIVVPLPSKRSSAMLNQDQFERYTLIGTELAPVIQEPDPLPSPIENVKF